MLLGVREFIVPVVLVEYSLEAIQHAARRGDETFVVWTGASDGDTFRFVRATVPRQTAHKTAHGLLVTIDGQTLFELNRDCYGRGELLAGQIHAHPDTAYHSAADDELAIVAVPGGLSVVIPDFARAGLDGVASWACFRLGDDGRWAPLDPSISVKIQ
jgi:hypothetical protein